MAYPDSIDSFTTKVDDVTEVAAAHVNDAQTAIVAIETELGTLVKGGYGDVKARIVAAEGGAGGGTLDQAYDMGGGGSGRTITVDSGAVALVGANEVLNLSTNIWRLGGVVFDLDFTGTSYDTDAEMQAAGIRLSDVDTPFPTTLQWAVVGTWAHDAGVGWEPTCTEDGKGPAMLIPLCRPGNWELEIVITFDPGNVADKMQMEVGYLTNSNHMGGKMTLHDANAGANELICYIYTNDGDDTNTARYTGNALAGSGDRTYALRMVNGCIGVYDEEDDAWNYYTGRQSTGHAYTAGWAFIQFYKWAAVTLAKTTIANLKLTYLL